jgi:hypothetical protein
MCAVFANLFAPVTANSFAEWPTRNGRFFYIANKFAITGANEFANTGANKFAITGANEFANTVHLQTLKAPRIF